MADQPRWPVGTPVAPSGKGPGGGRFRGIGTPGVGGWLQVVSGRITRGWSNDGAGRAELQRIVDEKDGEFAGEDISGNTGTTRRVELPDGRAIVAKRFHWDENQDEDEGEFDDWEYESEEARAQHEAMRANLRAQPTDEDLGRARAEVVASRVAEAIGALVPPVIPAGTPANAVWMGFVDGEAGLHLPGREDYYDELSDLDELDVTSSSGRDAWRLGLLDLLIANVDRHAFNIITTPDGRIYGIDHGEAAVLFEGGLLPPTDVPEMLKAVDSPFAGLFAAPIAPLRLTSNPLHPDDTVVLTARLYRLWQDGILKEREYRYMAQVLGFLSPHASGDRRLIE